MASVAESLFADDARSRRKKKKRSSSKVIDAVVNGDVEDAAAGGDWQPFTSPDGRTYYYNQVTRESRWKLPRALRQKQEADAKASDTAPAAVSSPRKPPRHEDEKAKKKSVIEKPSGPASARGDIVARLQASLAGRINPMAGAGGGPPPMIKIPRGIPEASDSAVERSRTNSTGGSEASGGGIFSAAGAADGENPEGEYDAETAGMTPAERLRFIRRKRQESMFKKEKIVEEDDFMKEFAQNMKKKEAERVQRMTPEQQERERQAAERKTREAAEKKTRDEAAQRKKRAAEEETEREKQREREEEQKRFREDEKKKAKADAEALETEQEAHRLREKQELEQQQRTREEEKKRQQESEAKPKTKEEKRHEEEEEQQRDTDLAGLVRQRSRTTSSSSLGAAFAPVDGDATGNTSDAETTRAKARRRTRSNGSKTFAADAVVYTESHRSRPSSRRSVKHHDDMAIQDDDMAIQDDDTPLTRTTEAPLLENASEPVVAMTEALEGVRLETEETAEDRAARKERRRKKKERRRQEEHGETVVEEQHEASPSAPSSTSSSASPHCQCATCLHANAHSSPPPPYNHQPPGTSYPHGSYPYYPPNYPPPPFYPPPPPQMYGYASPPPPFFPMYAPPQMMYPPNMFQMPMLMAPPLSGGGPTMMNGMPGMMDSTNGAMIAMSPYAQYLPPVLSQCESCRGRGVGLAEKNGLCAHCNRLRLDFIVVSAQIRRRCTVCSGWGLGLIQDNGMCAHCTRVTDNQPSGQSTGSRTLGTTAVRTPPVDWDASSSDGDSDWDE